MDLSTTEETTSQSRSKQLASLLSSLLVDKISLPASESTPAPSSSSPTLVSKTTLPSITQVYSHQKRTYHVQRIIVTSDTLPLLRRARASSSLATSKGKGKASEEELSQSLPGRGKWVDEEEVLESNIGGAMIKVWEVRNGGKGNGPVGNGENKKQKVLVVKKVGSSPMKNGNSGESSSSSTKRKGKKLDRYETSEEEAEASGASSSSEEEVEVEVKEESKVPYKKRRIMISDEENEDE